MSNRVARDWQLYIKDMITFSETALSYVEGMTQAFVMKGGLFCEKANLHA